jgi:phosphopantothenoylcysteine decarboxylase/phosphopantothenate--cysteine ligase
MSQQPSSLKDKKIILGVCGSIAAYKSAYLLRELQRKGAEVRVVMTPSAAKFVASLTFSSLSNHPVLLDMFSGESTSIEHVRLGLWADVMLIAPVTASTIAKLTQGSADNLLTVTALALRAPLIIAPAMDVDMYIHPTTAQNISKLKERGVVVLEPGEGELASGLTGVGRLAEVEEIISGLERFFEGHPQDFVGKRVLVTAGPTQEPIDAVRFISNRSSGKMGFAVASAAANRGAEVRLVSGPVSLETPRNVLREDVMTADEMHEAVTRNLEWCEVLFMTAAVADYKVLHPHEGKIKKSEWEESRVKVDLVENIDILGSLSGRKGKRIFVGFALETENGVENAAKKLSLKSLDMIVLNDLRDKGAGFSVDTNKVTLLFSTGVKRELPIMPKYEVALKILDEVKVFSKENGQGRET